MVKIIRSWSKLWRLDSLRSHLIAIVLATTVPLLVFAVAMIIRLGNEERATFQRGATERTRALLTAVDSEIRKEIAALEALATSSHLDSEDLHAFYNEAARVLKSQPGWFTIILTSPTGKHLLNLSYPFGADLPGIAEESSFTQLVRTGTPTVGQIAQGGKKRYAFPVRVPVRRDGEIKYVLSAIVNPKSISALLEAQKLPSDLVAVVIDANRNIVAGMLAPDQSIGQPAATRLPATLDRAREGWFQGTTSEGREVYTAYNRSPFSGWGVALVIPADVVEASLRRSFVFVVSFGVVLLSLAIALAWFFGKRTARSIESLSAMAEELGLGKKSRNASAFLAAQNGLTRIAEVENVRDALLSASRLIQDRSQERDRLEQALQRQADLLELSHDAIFVREFPAGPIVYWNRGAETLYCYPKAEAIGQPPHLLLKTFHPQGIEFIESALERDGTWSGELRHTTRDGRQIFVDSKHVLVHDPEGKRVVLETNRDVTERKQTERRIAANLAITQMLAQSGSLRDATTRILRTVGETLDWEVGDVWIPHSDANELRCLTVWHSTVAKVDNFVALSYGRRFAPGEGLPGRVWKTLKPAWIPDVSTDGNFYRVPSAVEAGLHAAFAFPVLFRDKFLGVMEFFSSEIREPDAALLAMFESIGNQIGQFMERKGAEEAVREADRRKDQFLAILGHELRNPLGVISTVVQLLRRKRTSEAELQEFRETIEFEVSHLARLLDDLLDVSRIARGLIRLRKEPCDFAMTVRQVTEGRRAILEKNGVKLSVQLPAQPVWVMGDRTRLAQIVGNLLDNANKFTDAGPQVTVRLLKEMPAEVAVLSVRDTGIGMDREMLKRIFEPFTQADRSIDRSRGGLGLGLAIVKGLADLHEGQVYASSDGPGRGSEFTVRLACAHEPRMVRKPIEPIVSVPERRHILVIEDNVAAARSLRVFLGEKGHRVEIAHTGPDGVEAARRVRPDVVLCDIGLPGLDGYAVARLLRQEAELKGLCLIAVSGYGQEADQRRALAEGFDAYLTKPIDFKELERVLNNAPIADLQHSRLEVRSESVEGISSS